MPGKFGFKLDMPTPTAMKIFYEAAPGTLVRQVHHDIVNKVASAAIPIMKQKIREKFPLYHPSEKHKRWQTPTGALANSIGRKVISSHRMKAKDKLAVAFVGARTDFTATKAVKQRIAAFRTFGFEKRRPASITIPQQVGDSAVVRPSRYLHLAQFGHGPGPKGLSFHAKGRDFMNPTIAAVTPIMMSIIKANYDPAMQKALSRDKRRIERRGGRRVRISV